MEQRIILGTTSNTMQHTPPRACTSPTYVIEDLIRSPDAPDRVLASGNAGTGGSTTLDAAAGWSTGDPLHIPLTATGSVSVGGRYWIQNAEGLGEIVEVVGIVANDYVTAATPLLGEYASGATFSSLVITAPFPDVEVTEQRSLGQWPMRVIWSYTIAGTVYRVADSIVIVRDTATEGSTAEAFSQLTMMFPDLLMRAQTDGRDVGRVAEACRRELHSWLRSIGKDPERLLVGDIGRDLLFWKICDVLAMSGIAPGGREADAWARDARERFNAVRLAIVTGVAGAAADLDVQHQSPGGPTQGRRILGGL